jgi:D-serine deaminase-like pyridoxal phosphate-dependent protein
MPYDFRLTDPASVPSPALLFSLDAIRHNLYRLVQRAGGPERLRPHVKTHKTRHITRMERDVGINKHKAATIAEAEMLAQEGVPDILVSYPLLGPNATRFARLVRAYPDSQFLTIVDHGTAAEQLSQALAKESVRAEVLLDVDVGQNRTGIPPGDAAFAVYKRLAELPGVRPGGLHVYDGHNHQAALADRETAVQSRFDQVLEFRDRLLDHDLPVPRLVLGGTPTFPIYAKVNLPGVELAPGTCVLGDHGYGSKFLDMDDFAIAALMLTRVISKPTPTRLTLDLGYKSVAGDPPAGKRVRMLDMDDYEQVLHNEEHLVIDTPHAGNYGLGDVLYAMPTHICPTCALHQEALVVQNGAVVDAWPIAARDRRLTI